MKKFNTIDRHRTSSASHTTFLAATQSDRARLIYSAAFRRLQQKAQVFSLENNSAVRSRLTHSIEVSHMGRYIIAEISEQIRSSDLSDDIKKYWFDNDLALSNIVETACLMHDIGNPPFGHFGEAAISQWAHSSKAIECLSKAVGDEKDDPTPKPLRDFRHFDGNPQGFRIITKLQGEDGFYGLNLTYTQLAAFIKYTHSPDTKEKLNGQKAPFSKKVGFFDTELEVIKQAWETLGMKEHTRHPLGFLMEASDDMSYCISDIEDGIEKGVILERDFKEDMLRGINHLQPKYHDTNDSILKDLEKSLTSTPDKAIGPFLSFKTCLSNYLVKRVATKFVENYEKFVNLEVEEEIISKSTIEYDLLDLLKVYTGKFLFTSNEAECMELSGFSIISGILDEYQKLLELPKELFLHLITNSYDGIKTSNLHIHRRLFNRLPTKHLNTYKCSVIDKSIPELKKDFVEENKLDSDKELSKEDNDKFTSYFNDKVEQSLKKIDPSLEWNLRAHLVVDFVSGMTDQFSMEFFQMLKGINVK
ncbi:dGTPase [Vibrio cholerae]|uniref:dGTPase n=1 Tax=Vibrio cholerae TaxID=666 RepID=UPI0006E6FAD8|nr:dGTPase [Vibrio cholerae]MBY7899161.1 dGTPase [Vibrio fluvialis]KQA15672.1 deoxyguanosinetriphosphate triphosphohydrolase [Vibrio cholerae]KQA84406.1 deoxyguanosinetriphosphate triphosphohydrolase [Vibrio cholerae]KQA91985.1 deoxyguanosinetriphosphate triphosphohydrolase [Vibrio cholerae]PAR75462.1 dGTPase [Vibrio cholerae]